MMLIRPIQASDWDGLWALAHKTGPGFTTLQPDEPAVRRKLDWALESFEADKPLKEALYLFVLEDTDTGEIAGISGIESAVGLQDPWYNYRVGTLVHASQGLNVYNPIKTLTLSNDHTGQSEVCTLFLDPEFRRDGNGGLLSKSRFMFMAEFPHCFTDNVIAEMRGYSDSNGVSPFWEGLGRHFFSIDFAQADQLSGQNKVFIAELMPKNPIYTNMLPDDAREAIGQTHDNTTPARRLLESEGFRYSGYIDIFDGGPLLETRVQDIRIVRESRYCKVRIGEPDGGSERYLLANSRLRDFRCCAANASLLGNHIVTISADMAKVLNVQDGDSLRVAPMSARRSF
ncbi:arginine N-succinyltransferase [Motiliproteus coralliicola]|uniref:Arginine N-succinyltransferase n=1 Tax=Motiliproteus coralliicola TaxID=2283196 RepID=A0A369W8B1_9GAMM|nr:arginine N-succinyltransferase [Motiliproteus coralliicola]RDE18238.1 arginine N-succinyltransferase [Motiliproteus coralliicola]